jgi:hypothetical protein
VDSTGDFLTLVPLHDPAYTSAAPPARAASPTPSSSSTAARSVFSITTTNTAATSTTGVASQSPAKRLCLDSLFNTRRGYHVPLVSLAERIDGTKRSTPPAPVPVSLGPSDWRSWLGGLVSSGSVTGDQIDALCMYSPCILCFGYYALCKAADELALILLQWPARIDLFQKNLSPVLNPLVTPSGKQGPARQGQRPHQVSARRAICTTDCTRLYRSAGKVFIVLFWDDANNIRMILGICSATWKRVSTRWNREARICWRRRNC